MNWYKNVLRNPSIRLSTSGKSMPVLAKPITESKPVKEVVDKFKAKYGAEEIRKWYTGLDMAVEVRVLTP